jgi:hypothetical protein
LDSPEINTSRVGGASAAGLPAVATTKANELAHTRAVTRELGALLIVSGIAGILLPGPVGTPLLVLGCVMVWPRAFSRIERMLEKHFPRTHRVGVSQSARFLSDLERRYPAPR